jgi:hypothetical protein
MERCPNCHDVVGQLVEFDDTNICEPCWDKIRAEQIESDRPQGFELYPESDVPQDYEQNCIDHANGKDCL